MKNISYFILLIFIYLSGGLHVFPESDIYDRIGIIPEHGMHGAVPEENIDLFTGNLTLRFMDIRLPGPNGFNLEIWRVYNSKIVKDHFPYQGSGYNQEPRSWVGLGWSMHMGRVHNYNSDEPVIEFPDGRWETAYPNANGSGQITRSFLKYDKTTHTLYFKDGTTWTFGEIATLHYIDSSPQVRMVTEIENSYGDKIIVTYRGGLSIIDKITDCTGRQVLFETDDTSLTRPKLDKIKIKNAYGQWITYDYTVGEFAGSNYYKLDEYNPPEISPSIYDYYCDTGNKYYEIQSVDTSFGGRLEYEYEDHEFYFYNYRLYTRVVKTKRIRFSPTDSFKTWTYTYPNYQNTTTGTVTVNGPLFDTYATYYGFSTASPSVNGWKIGLLKEKWMGDNSYSEQQEWTYHQVSNNNWIVLSQNLGTIKAPLLYKSIKTRRGDAGSTEEYLYERTNVKNFGLPTKIKYYGGANGTTLKSYKTLDYFFETNSTYLNKYMVDYIKKEAAYSSGGTKLKETQTKYFSTTAKYGAIDEIKKWKTGSTYLTWDYGYDCNYYNTLVTITINLPGTAGTETYKYSYGVLSELKRPGYTTYPELSRTISAHNSVILSETNQHGGTMIFTYDGLNRVMDINMPPGFNDIDASWSTNSVTITQGGNALTKYWDGMGRDTGYIESGDNITLYYRKILDAEGRILEQSKGSTDSDDRYTYILNAVGNPTTITDPRGKVTDIAYSGTQKTVTDAENNQTIFYYEGLPGLPTRLKDADARYADYTYDGIGRITQVKYNNARTQSYAYNGLDQVSSETHPETGAISYTYNTENQLWQKIWGGVTLTHTYNSANQLTRTSSGIGTGAETIDYDYDTRGRVDIVSSTEDWGRDQITYNSLGAVTNERQDIPGIGNKTFSYDYDGNNNLESVTYPDGKAADITNNSLNMPETLRFNGKYLVGQAAYGINKQPTSLTISGNGTAFTASYNSMGFLTSTFLKEGFSTRYRADYGYDNVGNITSIYNTTPGLNGSFGYDDLYRLTSASYTGGKSYNYTYDYYGNLRTAKENGSTVFSRIYSSKNRIDSADFAYDSRGNMTAAPGWQYQWDRQNRLSSIENGNSVLLSTHMTNERGLRIRSGRLPAPSLSVTSPNGGESLGIGSPVNITWTDSGIVEDVKIEYSLNNGTSWTEITASTENDGIYPWTVPGTTSSLCLVRVSEIDGDPSDVSDAVFSIIVPAAITITAPNGGEELGIGSSTSITWTSTGTVGNVKIEYSTDSGTSWTEIIASTANSGSYNWTVPNNLTSNGLVRVSEIGGGPSDVSDAVFSIIIPPTITVTSPNGGETWQQNTTYNITWTTTGTVGNVMIDYSTDTGSSWTTIVSSTINDGGHYWTVPATPSSNCLVRVRETDGSPSDSSNSVFSIVEPLSVTVTSPNGGEMWEIGSTQNITWNSTGIVENVRIYYSTNNGTSWTTIVTSTVNTGSYSWTIPDTPSNYCRVRVMEVNGSVLDNSDAVFSIVVPASISIASPNGGENWETGSSHDITWTATGTVGNIAIDYSIDNGSSWTNIVASTANDGLYTWTLPGTTSDTCRVRVKDVDGYPVDMSDAVFSIVLPPSITITSPNGGESWEVGDFHSITWTSTGIVGNVKIDYSINNGVSWTGIVSSTENDGDYTWQIPNEPSNNCLIRVSEIDNDPSDTSDGVFAIVLPSNLKVISPNGGETWAVGSLQTITWASPGGLGNVNIAYSIDSGLTWKTIVNATADNGFYEWTVPDAPSANGLVRIRETDGDGGTQDSSDGVFSIVLPSSPTVTVNTPNGGEGLIIDSVYQIKWTSYEDVGDVKIEYSTNSGGSWTEIAAPVSNSGSYDWTIPGAPSENCLVRVGELDGEPFDVSDGEFSIITGPDSSITVTSPNGGESLAAGSTHAITWETTGTVGNLIIEYSLNNGDTWKEIAASTANDGSYEWTVPDSPSDNCLVRISEKEEDLLPSDVSDAVFSIISPGTDTITVISPNGKETLTAGSAHDITWSSSGTVGEVKIEYSTDSGVSWHFIAGSVVNSGSYSWMIPDLSSDHCLVRISEDDEDGTPWDVSNAEFSIVSPSTPTIIISSPNGGESLAVGSVQPITWNSYGDVADVKIDYSIDNGSNWIAITPSSVNNGSYDWTVSDSVSESCLVRVSEIDGEPSDVSNGVFSIIVEPTITVLSPNGGENLEAGTYHTITWDITGNIDNIKIEYSIDGGATWSTISRDSSFVLNHEGHEEHEENRPKTPVSQKLLRGVQGGGFLEMSPPGRRRHEIHSNNNYEWLVPDVVSGNCLVRVSGDSDVLSVSDVSDGVFSIVPPAVPSVVVSSPDGGESLIVGSIFKIEWESFGTVGDIKIDYSIDGGANWAEIISTTSNSGSYEWTVPDAPSSDCLVRVMEIDGDPTDVSDAVFSIVTPSPGSITVVYPNGGESLSAGASYDITWSHIGTIDNVDIEYSTDSGTLWNSIVISTVNDGAYSWAVPDAPSEICLIRISKSDSDGDPSDVSDAAFSIVSSTPSITVTSPNGSEGLIIGSVHTITWTFTGAIDLVNIAYSVNSGDSWTSIAGPEVNDGSYDWTVPDTPSDQCLLRIRESDSDGGPSDISDATFSIVTDTSPSCGTSWLRANYSGIDTFTSAAYGNSRYVVVGNAGKIMSGTNGIAWTAQTSGTISDLKGIVYGGTQFVAVGGEGVILTGSNGTDWAVQTSGVSGDLNGVAYGINKYAAVGNGGTISTSADGMNWTLQSSGITADLNAIVYGGNQFVAVGNSGTILTAFDGINWTKRSSGAIQHLRCIAYGNDIFVAVGDSGTVLVSSNGIEWYKRTTAITVDLLGAAFGNNTFVIVGGIGKILTGSDGISWTVRSSSVRDDLFAAVYGNLKFIAVGTGKILYSLCEAEAAASADIINSKSIHLLSPNGNEIFHPGERYLISWQSVPGIEKVKLEYSVNNGTTYHSIINDYPNSGTYEWEVPHHISSNCLVRVGKADSVQSTLSAVLYELKFRVPGCKSPPGSERFTVSLGDIKNTTMLDFLPVISFTRETDGNTYLDFNGTIKEIQSLNSQWHILKVLVNQEALLASIWLNNETVFENISLSPGFTIQPAVSFTTKGVEINEMVIKVKSSPGKENNFTTLLKQGPGKSVEIKDFDISMNFPFDVSDKPFEIRYNKGMNEDAVIIDTKANGNGHGPYSTAENSNTSNTARINSDELINTYYLYSFDGKLMSEYDHYGNCVKDYIYAGNRLIAEYQPQTNKYYYYMTDQINSTRIITDDSGDVVYSEAYGPYGDVQKTWTKTYDPKQKFSGKERETYSDLDYFGARYYDHNTYRFNSVDPIINKKEALTNPQLWNLYSYCRNNPVTYFDPTGEKIQISNKELINEFEHTLGIRMNFEDKSNPNLVTGFIVKHEQLKEMLKMLQEIIDDPKMIKIIDKSETNHDSLTLAYCGASFDEGNVYIDRSVYFEYIKKGFFARKGGMPVGEKIIHELIGHGYDYIKGEKGSEKKVIRRINELYRRPLGIDERVEK